MLGNVGQATDIADTLKRSYGGSPAVLASPISMQPKAIESYPHALTAGSRKRARR
ncbi:hypothetical protein AB7M42_007671 [Bradyrhizobium diazoefficiens]|jgi:hypothetical protein|uniref:Uncharacterized protein n=3 Tax=Bradyrhizobium TaxID=374 RepID=A0ABV4FU05_9BRAD|nr:hypothetical protein [Bradyrhizobium japonicum]MCS3899469.1 hypothetical protein [Bradyrhizobium japonicum USDA 38]MCS3933114.1 hypothetical protein [Bradyrhizobium elkanii]TWH94064.1 hypothetical protein IQ17_06878 [Bradyrhizobium daqingense]MBP1089869.1 hypothetical protein [Bradyrhizobium japonicum]